MSFENFHYHWIFIYYLINLLIITESEILNNPFQISITSNPIIINDENEIQIYYTNNKLTQNIATREIISTESFCRLSEKNSLIHNKDTDDYYIYSQTPQYLVSASDNIIKYNLLYS